MLQHVTTFDAIHSRGGQADLARKCSVHPYLVFIEIRRPIWRRKGSLSARKGFELYLATRDPLRANGPSVVPSTSPAMSHATSPHSTSRPGLRANSSAIQNWNLPAISGKIP